MPTTYQEYQFDSFVGGLNLDLDPEVVPKHFITSGQNIQYNFGVVQKREGRNLFGPAFPFTGIPNGLFVFLKSNGTNFLLAKTTQRLYNYTGSVWNDITPTTGTVASSAGVAPQFVTYNDKVYLTDGTNPIITWDGVAATASTIQGNGSPSAAGALIPFAGYLHVIQPTVTGTFYGWRDMWSDLNQPTIFNSGQAGAVDLNDTAELVQTAAVYGRYLGIYKAHSIYATTFIGPPLYFDYRRIDIPGTIAPRTVILIPNLGLFSLGPDDIYISDFQQSRPIGKPIRQELFSSLKYSALSSAFAYIRPDLGIVRLCVPFSATTPDTVFSYNYLDGQWMPEGPYPITAGIWAEYALSLTVSQMTQTVASYTMTIQQLKQLTQRVPLLCDGSNILYAQPGQLTDFFGVNIVLLLSPLQLTINEGQQQQFNASILSQPTAGAINSNFSTAQVALAQRQDGTVVPCTVFGIKVTANDLPGTVNVSLAVSIGNGQYVTRGPFPVTFTQSMVIVIPVEVTGERFQVQISNANANEGFAVKSISLLYKPRGRI